MDVGHGPSHSTCGLDAFTLSLTNTVPTLPLQLPGCAGGWNAALQYMSAHDDVPWAIISNHDIKTPAGALAAFAADVWAAIDADPRLCIGHFTTEDAGVAGRYTSFVYTRHALNTLGLVDANLYPAYYEGAWEEGMDAWCLHVCLRLCVCVCGMSPMVQFRPHNTQTHPLPSTTDVELDICLSKAVAAGACSPFPMFNASRFIHGKEGQRRCVSGSRVAQQRLMAHGDRAARAAAVAWSERIQRGKLSSPLYLELKCVCVGAIYVCMCIVLHRWSTQQEAFSRPSNFRPLSPSTHTTDTFVRSGGDAPRKRSWMWRRACLPIPSTTPAGRCHSGSWTWAGAGASTTRGGGWWRAPIFWRGSGIRGRRFCVGRVQ